MNGEDLHFLQIDFAVVVAFREISMNLFDPIYPRSQNQEQLSLPMLPCAYGHEVDLPLRRKSDIPGYFIFRFKNTLPNIQPRLKCLLIKHRPTRSFSDLCI